MRDLNTAPACGLDCRGCQYFGEMCGGCGVVNGRPFWTGDFPGGVCPFHGCCREKKELEHCGLCAEFPCKPFTELRDPAMSEEEFKTSLESRRKELARRTEIGTAAWLVETSVSES